MSGEDGIHVIVVGAGFVGVTLADALVKRGARVTMLAPSRELEGASGTSYAWLNSHRKRPDIYQLLNQRALEFWRDRFGPAHPDDVHWSGHVVALCDSANIDVLSERLEYLTSLGYAGSWCPRAQVERALPLHLPSGAVTARFPSEGHCDPLPIWRSLVESLERSGRCRWELGEAVGVHGPTITLRSGATITGDRVVIAAGNGSSELLRTAGARLPMVSQEAGGPAWGFLADIHVPAHGIDFPVTTDNLNLRPTGPDSLLVQALDLDAAAGPDAPVDETLRRTYARRATALLGREDVEVCEVRIGHRVIPADGMTVAGPVDGSPKSALWTVVTHSGITLAPLLASLTAQEIVESALCAQLDDFRPTRFSKTGTADSDYSPPRRPGEQ